MLRETSSILSVILGSLCGSLGAGISAGAVPPQLGLDTGKLVLIENRGQWPIRAELVGRLGPLVVRLEPDAIALQLRQDARRGVLVRLGLEGITGPALLEGADPLPGHYSYFLGNDPSQWQRAVPAWEKAIYRDVWPGVDLIVRIEGARLKYDLNVAPGAVLGLAIFTVAGTEGMRIEADGSLVIDTAAGPIIQPLPISYEILASGERRPVVAHYRLLEGMRFGFAVDARDAALPLVIDPGLMWSSYLGSSSVGSAGDTVYATALGPNGEAIVAGSADWGDFPVTPGAYATPFVPVDIAFVSVFDPSGSSLVYSCIVGGTQPGYSPALAVGVDATQHVVVAGSTSQAGFPTTPGAFDTVKSSVHSSAFVFKLEPDGSDLVYSTFLDGSQSEEAFALAVTPGGAVVVGGESVSPDFPTTPGAFDTLHGPGIAPFLARLNPEGSQLEWATYLGDWRAVRAICLDVDEVVYATGTATPVFPATPGAFDTTFNGGSSWDGFVAKLSADGKNLIFGTYLGGLVEDRPSAIALDSSGGVVVAGRTRSLNFPTTSGAFQSTHAPGSGNYDGFVTRLNAAGTALVYSTYLGGISWDEPFGVAIDAAGVVTVAGLTADTSFPTTAGAYDETPWSAEGFVSRLSPDGKRLFYSTFIGEMGSEQFNALAMDAQGIVTVGGWTTGPYPVTPAAFATSPFGGQTDGMVTRMDLLPRGAVPFGTSTPACYGPLVIGVTEMPAAGSFTFGLYASGAPPGSSGLLGLAPSALSPGLPIVGLTLLIDPGPGLIVLPATAQATPYAEVTVPIPAGATGHQAHAQFVFLNTATCGGVGTFSATNALALRVQ